MSPRAVIFDAYGTLFDVHSVILRARCAMSGDVHALSELWRQRQLEYTWLLSLMERYENFWSVTRTALQSAASELQIEANAAQLERLMQAYLSPSAFPDVEPALKSLSGLPLAILSNGLPEMLDSAVHHNGLESRFAEIISVDRVRTYKPSPRVYALGGQRLCLPAAEILFVSSNWWDVWGAKTFGYAVCWCNRSKTEIRLPDDAPDLMVSRLDQIADCLGAN